jgi:Tol biopolymer transport system component
MPDGRSFLLSANRQVEDPTQLWQVFHVQQGARQLTNDLSSYTSVTVSTDGKSVATVQAQTITSVSALDPSSGQQRQLISSRRNDGFFGLTWTPRGAIVFASSRSGTSQSGSKQEHGSDLRQLTQEVAPAGYPAVSDDGRWVVYVSLRPEGAQLWRVPIDQSERPAFLAPAVTRFACVIDRDGWVYYTGVDFKPYRVRLEGGTPSGPLIADSLVPTDMTPTGELIAYSFDTKARRGLAAIMPASGGALRLLPDFPLTISNLHTLRSSPHGTALTFVEQKEGVSEVWLKPLGGGAAQRVTHSGGEHVFSYAWSTDGKRLAMARGRTESDVVLIHRK